MKKYAIVDNQGNVYAHDIQSKEKAKLKLNDTINELKETMTEEEINELEIEVIEGE